MSCPHALHGSPSQCSLCLGVTPKRVAQVADVITVDGVPVRPIAEPVSVRDVYSRKKGGRR